MRPTTREELAAATEVARRKSRFRFAKERLEKIAAARPAFTHEEIDQLASVFRSRAIATADDKAVA